MPIEEAIQELPKAKSSSVFVSDFIAHEISKGEQVPRIWLTIGLKGDLQNTVLNDLPVINIDRLSDWFVNDTDTRPCKVVADVLEQSHYKELHLLFNFDTLYKPTYEGYDFGVHAARNRKIARRVFLSVIKAQKKFFARTFKLAEAKKGQSFLQLATALGVEQMMQVVRNGPNCQLFDIHHISESDNVNLNAKLEQLFGGGEVEQVYAVFKDCIGNKRFVYGNVIYQYTWEEVKRLKHQHAERFVKVKGKYIQITLKTVKDDIEIRSMDKYNRAELKEDYGPQFLQEVDKYDDFIIEPLNVDAYKRVIYRRQGNQNYKFYNLYEPLPIKPVDNSHHKQFSTLIDYFKHLSQGEATLDNPIRGDKFTLLMDWLRVAVRYPKARLPMLIFSTKERGTGKSTFLILMQYLFGINSTTTNMTDLLGKFNSHIGDKTMVLLEEVKMEGDKHVNNDMLKDLITGDTKSIEPKGLSKYQVGNYTRYVAASNHEEKILPIDEGTEDRFLVMRPKSLGAKRDGGETLKKMKKEMPYLLRYLLESELTHGIKITEGPNKGEWKGEDRLWFKGNDVRTKEFYDINKFSRSAIEKDITGFVKNTFSNYLVGEFRANPAIFHKNMKDFATYRYSVRQIHDFLSEKLGNMKAASIIHMPIGLYQDDNGVVNIEYYKHFSKKAQREIIPIQRYFKFLPEDWMEQNELAEFKEAQKVGLRITEEGEGLAVMTEENKYELFSLVINSLPIVDNEWHSIQYMIDLFASRVQGQLSLADIRDLLHLFRKDERNTVQIDLDTKGIRHLDLSSKISLRAPF